MANSSVPISMLYIAALSRRTTKRVRVGHVLVLKGRLNAVFGSSMETEVQVFSEDPLTAERNITTRAFVTMVSVDSDGKPQAAPPLAAADETERERAARAAERRRGRLALRDASRED